MLIELRIRNLAVIEDLSLELGPGLNALTGETGAGKSIIVGALSLLLGERASSDSVRAGAERASVEAVFDISEHPELHARLEELGFESDGDLLVLRREVQAEGRNRAWINGSPATAGVVGEFGRALVDLHGQHEHQTLLRAPEQRAILDSYAGAEALARTVSELHRRASDLRVQRQGREARGREIEDRSAFLRAQREEIRDAQVAAGEDTRVHEELERLEHAEELARESEAVHGVLYSSDGSVSDGLAEARDALDGLARFDPELVGLRDEVDELYHRASEAGRAAGRYSARIDVSPARAEGLRRRADLLFRLKRKYGPEFSDVLDTLARAERELAELDETGLELGELTRQLDAAEKELHDRAGELSRKRKKAGERLAREAEGVLSELGMPGARFRVELEPLGEPESGGAERVQFLASLNPGFEVRPLAKIASGGELSRVMLALKSILTREDPVPTLIFDEIDAGIGGAVAVSVASKLQKVGELHQVVVVTHLAQLASRGQRHLHVEKVERDGKALATVQSLDGEGRVRELARMLGGDPDSKTSRDHARELLATEK
ncbi:MAG: DNA repair protein RecN [Gemmatimonadetes bacterium]|nr:DNA repair protein RecN [Gemmatimonadota bacterium]